jgi:Flp pilus assembly protein TadD
VKTLKVDEDNWVLAATLDTLGYSLQQVGDLANAEAALIEACQVAERSAHHGLEPVAWMHLGDVLSQAGRPDRARQAWQTALGLAKDSDQMTAQELHGRLALD